MRSIVVFLAAVVRHWAALVTGAVAVAALEGWAFAGHPVAPWAVPGVTAAALLTSCFQTWKEQFDRAGRVEEKLAGMAGRPELALRCTAVKPTKMDPQDWSAMGAETMFQFAVRNSGSIQAVNVDIDDIVVLAPEARPAEAAGRERWAIVFEKLSSVTSGQELAIPFRIEGMGPFLNRDICHCLGQANRADAAAPVRVPLLLRFSNRDGSRWIQKHDLVYSFPSKLTVEYMGIERERE